MNGTCSAAGGGPVTPGNAPAEASQTPPPSPQPSLKRRAASALFWSSLQYWGGRIVGLLIFVLLARLLNPADFGLAASAFLVMTLLNMIAEFGCSDALVQRKELRDEDINLPFFLSMAASVTMATLTFIFAPQIVELMRAPGLTPYLRAAAMICPFMTFLAFQEFLYRRAIMFRQLATRTIAGTVSGGVVGIAMALTGWGTWSLIAQYACQTLVGVVWLWRKPLWKPSLTFHPRSALEIASFGSKILGVFVIDFTTQKSVDLIILRKFGIAALGLFTVSTRLYMLLLQMLQTSINNVGLTMLSTISHDMDRMRRLYIRTTSVCATLGTPVFVGLAVLAPEVNQIMFGSKWLGAEKVMMPLLLIGGVHCTQFVNTPYLTVTGNPRTLLHLSIFRSFLVLPPLYLIPSPSVSSTASLYALCLLAVTPFDFLAAFRALSIRIADIARPIGMPITASIAAFLGTHYARSALPALPANPFLSAIVLGSLFALAYMAVLASLGRDVLRENFLFVRGFLKKA
ncbi:MAG: lipopolysaccharide biosynthesis protein [Sphingobium sp.]